MFAVVEKNIVVNEDDTESVQKAFDQVSDHKQVNLAPEVVFPAGVTYRISKTILIPYGVRVTAHGATIESTVGDGKPAFQWGDDEHKPWVGSWTGGTLRYIGKESPGDGFLVYRANHGVIEDVRLGSFRVGINLSGPDPVQWEIRRCFVGKSHVAGILASHANVLRIVGGKIHCKDRPNALGLDIRRTASVEVSSLDISICEGGAAKFFRCTGLDVRSLYTERCGGVEYNDDAVVSLRECYGASFSGCRFNAANGTVTGASSLAWGMDAENCKGVNVQGCMSTTARKGFARVRGCEDFNITGCTEDYFGKHDPRISWDVLAIGKSWGIEKMLQSQDAQIYRGASRVDGTFTFEGGDEAGSVYFDVPCEYTEHDRFCLEAVITTVDTYPDEASKVKSDMPVVQAWMQSLSDTVDHNKQDRQTLIPLTKGTYGIYRSEWFPQSNGDTIRVHLTARPGWAGFTIQPNLTILRDHGQ